VLEGTEGAPLVNCRYFSDKCRHDKPQSVDMASRTQMFKPEPFGSEIRFPNDDGWCRVKAEESSRTARKTLVRQQLILIGNYDQKDEIKSQKGRSSGGSQRFTH
jgi:hypothetical protein